jgi:hypothetical protein
LVLGFAAIGISFFYVAYRYNILFVTDSQIDTKGLIYPRALQHLLTGVYISQVCMIGLFGVSTSAGPAILQAVFLIFTILFHIAMNSALDPLLYTLPKTLEAEEESLRPDPAVNVGSDPDGKLKGKVEEEAVAPKAKPSVFAKFFKPHIYSDYAHLRKLVPHHLIDADNLYTAEVERNAYYPSAVTSPTPLLWIPRDVAGVSAQEIAHSGKVIQITDEGAELNEQNKLVWDADGTRPPIWEEKTYY